MALVGVSPNDRRVDFPPTRPSYFPDIYVMENHPKNPGDGRSFYYLQDGSLKGMARVYDLEKFQIKVPSGGERGAVAAGFLELKPGDYLFVRLPSSPISGERDVPVAWVNPTGTFSAALQKETLEIRDRILGPPTLRSRTSPNNNNTGGTAFERASKLTGVRNGRCYSYGMTHERQNWLSAPCADGKFSNNSDATILLRQDLLRVTMDMSVEALMRGPPEVVESLAINNELLNIPRIGVEKNKFFPAAQLNLAPAEPSDSSNGLDLSLGTAGIDHIDENDHPAYFTHMVAVSDIPDNYHPGLFFILYPGVYMITSNFTSIIFSGLRKHGGTPPIAPPGTPLKELQWPTRVTFVSYPPVGLTTASQSRVIGAVGSNKVVCATEEVLHPERKPIEFENHATFSKDGAGIMPSSTFVPFMAQSILSLACTLCDQFPPAIKAKIDSDAFLRAFSYEAEDGTTKNVGPWLLGPGWRPSEDPILPSNSEGILEDQQKSIAMARTRWNNYLTHYAGHVPYAVYKGLALPLECSDENTANPSEPPIDGIAERPTQADLRDPFKLSKKKKISTSVSDQGKLKRKRSHKDTSKGGQKSTERLQSSATTGARSLSEIQPRTTKKQRIAKETPPAPQPVNDARRVSHRLKTKSQNPTASVTSQSRRLRPRSNDLRDFMEYIPSFLPDMNQTETPIQDLTNGPTDLSGNGTDESQSRHAGEPSTSQRKDVEGLPSYLHSFTTSRILDESVAVHESIMSIMSDGSGDWSEASTTSLSIFEQKISTDPLSKSSLSSIKAGWNLIQKLQSNTQVTSLLLRKQRSCIILSTSSTWRWIHIVIPEAIQKLYRGECGVPWLESLTSQIVEGLKVGGRVAFIASDFVDDAAGVSCMVDFTKCDRDSGNDLATLTDATLTILKGWIGYRHSDRAIFQAYLATILLRDFGPDIFILDATWSLYETVNQQTFRGTGPINFMQSSFPHGSPLHPLYDPTSFQRKTIHAAAQTIQDFLDGKARPPALPFNQPVTPIDIVPPLTQTFYKGRHRALTAFMKDAYASALELELGVINQDLKSAMDNYPDYYQPFREFAPTRVQMRKGPFSEQYARTLPGVFSAIIGRGITFGTPFSRSKQSRSVFSSVDDFKSARNETGETDPSYFCNKSAYGTTIQGRKVELAAEYWDALQEHRWPALDTEDPVPFLDLYHYFRPKTGKARFPQLGNLGAYLLTADYVYCGIAEPPTEMDMAYIIGRLKAGAATALELLGLILPKGPRKRTEEVYLEGFRRAAKLLMEAIPSNLHETLKVDFIMVEHALCKFKRAVGDKFIRV